MHPSNHLYRNVVEGNLDGAGLSCKMASCSAAFSASCSAAFSSPCHNTLDKNFQFFMAIPGCRQSGGYSSPPGVTFLPPPPPFPQV